MGTDYRYEAIFFIITIVLAVLTGWLSGEYWYSLSATLLIYFGWHFYQLLKLNRLVRQRQRLRPPFALGLWREIYWVISLYQQRSRKRKRNLTRFVTRFRDIATAIPDALVILDKDLSVNWANAATQSLLGFSYPAMVGHCIVDLLGNKNLQDYLAHGTYNYPVEMVPLHNKALVLSLRITAFGGKKRQRLLTARDITQLHHLNQMRRDFVANVSHELRTPITVINGYVENLLDTPSTPDNLRYPLERIHAQATRMTALIQNLLTLSRLENGEQATELVPINVAAMLTHITSEAMALSARHQLELEIDHNLWLMGNNIEIRSAFSNLIYNAIKHTDSGTMVRVIWHRNQHGPFLTVQDTGKGIIAAHLPRLTERFYRINKGCISSNGDAEGTGLGLAIVKHVLNRHNANLYISSILEQGSIFTCQFSNNSALTPPKE